MLNLYKPASKIIGRIINVKSHMNTFNYFYGLTILQLVLRHSHNLSTTLQKSSVASFQGKKLLILHCRQ